MFDEVLWWIGLIVCAFGGAIGLALMAWLTGNAWMDASRKWRGIFKAEKDIVNYRNNRADFDKWKKEKEEADDETD